jgi:hypothetical protein
MKMLEHVTNLNRGQDVLQHLNFEFTPLLDEHFDNVGKMLDGLKTLNLNGCKELTERTIMVIAKSCPSLERIGKRFAK